MTRNRVITLPALAACALAFSLPSMALAASPTDHGTFDSTNPANTEPGVYCRSFGNDGTNPRPWKLYVAMSNIGATVQTFWIRDNGGGFVQYRVPALSSLSLEYAGGNNTGSRAFRVDATGATTLSGYVSAEALNSHPGITKVSNVFCTSCDNDDAGPAFCDGKIAN